MRALHEVVRQRIGPALSAADNPATAMTSTGERAGAAVAALPPPPAYGDPQRIGVGPPAAARETMTMTGSGTERPEGVTRPRPAARGRILAVVVVGVVAAAAFAAGIATGAGLDGGTEPQREFMFEVTGLATPNQGGQTLNLYLSYRYDQGIAEGDIPNYLALREDALGYLATVDLAGDPYWETLNRDLCARLKAGYPLDAISCQLQVVGNDTPEHYEPGYHASVETIGDIDPLRVPGPPARPSTQS